MKEVVDSFLQENEWALDYWSGFPQEMLKVVFRNYCLAFPVVVAGTCFSRSNVL